MKVFISQPMRGREDEDIKAEREKIMDYLRKLYPDCEEVKSFFNSDIQSKNAPLRMLGMSLELMAEADIAVFANHWSLARGCAIEHEAARMYGIKIIDLED